MDKPVNGPMLDIRIDDVTGPEVIALLTRHLDEMHALTPAESVHALDLDGLRAPDVTLWTAWSDRGRDERTLLGCGALKAIGPEHGELKSFHTLSAARGRGVATALLAVIMDEARARGYRRLSLETGRPESFKAAQTLYARHGFAECPPFGDYTDDPFSLCMTLAF